MKRSWDISEKPDFRSNFDLFGPVSAATRIFKKNPALSLFPFWPYGPYNFMQKIRKN